MTWPDHIVATRAQKAAAAATVKRRESTGRPVSAAARKIAEATIRPKPRTQD